MMNPIDWIVIGVIFLVASYLKFPDFPLFAFFGGKEELEEGYEIDPVYVFSCAVVPPTVRTPDGHKGTFMGFKPNRNNSWDLETDEFTIPSVDIMRGVNWDCFDIVSAFCGRGDIYCNKNPDGKTIEGWMGIGTSRKIVMREKIRNLERLNADLSVITEETQERYHQARLKISRLEREIAETKGIRIAKIEGEEAEVM